MPGSHVNAQSDVVQLKINLTAVAELLATFDGMSGDNETVKAVETNISIG